MADTENQDQNLPQPTGAEQEPAQAPEPSIGDIAASLSEAPAESASAQPTTDAPEQEEVTQEAPLTTPRQYVTLDPNRPAAAKIPHQDFTPKNIVLPSLTLKAGEMMAARSRERSLDTKWLQSLSKMVGSTADLEAEQALQTPGSDWRQFDPDDNSFLGPTVSSVPVNREGQVEGDQAVLGFRSFLGMGAFSNVPLYGSGIRLKVEDPGDLALQELMREQTAEKGRIGRDTFATSFGARMVFTIESYVNLILANVRETTVKEGVPLRDHILITDFNPLIWGLACAVYNNGFDYHRPCTARPESCNHVETEHLNVSRVIHYDYSKLSREQRIHMKNRKAGVITAEDLQKYRDGFSFMHGTDVPIHSKKHNLTFYVTLQVPTIGEVIQSGHDWINHISQFVLEALGSTADPGARNVYMERVARTTAAQQHRHWIKSLTYNGAVMSKKEDLDRTFRDTISSDHDLIEQLEKAISDFSVKSTVAVVGVPDFTCSSCGRKQMVSEDGSATEVVAPFDPIAVFSDLMFQRMDKYLPV